MTKDAQEAKKASKANKVRALNFIPASLTLMALWADFSWAGSLVDVKDWEGRVTKHVLKNGLTVIVAERHEVPTVAFFTYATVGSVDEVVGITGMAHMFEHMAFKGTSTIGTKDFKVERKLMDEMEHAYEQFKAEKRKGAAMDVKKADLLQKEFRRLVEEASGYATNEYDYVIERAGAQRFNAYTSADQTAYHYSLPSNKLELWMFLESERYLDPVLRDFYKERDVVMEERRRSYEDKPHGKLYMQMINLAYEAHPYGVGTIGHMSDLQNITRREAEEFYRTHYTPESLIVVIAGDVEARETIEMAEAYFGRLPARAKPKPDVETVEPRQQGEKRITLELPFQPEVMVAFHVDGGATHPDWPVYQVLGNILTAGRTSRLERRLVQELQLATEVGCWTSPQRYPGLMMFSAPVAPGKNSEAFEAALYESLAEMGRTPVDAATLAKAKRQEVVGTLTSLNDNHSIARLLAYSEALGGDWRQGFLELDRIQAVTVEDVRRVAAKIFVPSNRTVGIIKNSQKGQQGQEGQKGKK